MLKIGLLGCGQHMSNTMVANIIGNMDSSIVAVCDINPQKTKKISQRLRGVAEYTDAETMFKEQNLDIVVISISPYYHLQYCKLAIKYGINIYVEKPIGHNWREIQSIYYEAEGKNVSIEYGAKWRYTAATNIAKKWIEENQEEIALIAIDATFPVGLEKNPWGLSPLDGAVQEVFVHVIDYVLYWLGESSMVRSTDIADNQDWHQAMHVLLKNDKGALASLNLIKGSNAYEIHVIIHTKSGNQLKIYNLSELEITCKDNWTNTHGTFRDHPSYNWSQGRLYRSWARAGMAEVWNNLVQSVKYGTHVNGLRRAYLGQKIVQQIWDKTKGQCKDE